MQKILAVFLAAVIVFGTMPVTRVQAQAQQTFRDVDSNHWAFDVIEGWVGYGVLVGYSGRFSPNRGITLAELASILTNTFGYIDRIPTEVTPAWATAPVEKAIAAGIIDAAEQIDAGHRITREQAVRYIARAYGVIPQPGTTAFADDVLLGEAYRPYVNAFQMLGYVRGRGNNRFVPQGYYTRAEAMAVLNNMVGGIVDESVSGRNFPRSMIVRSPDVAVTASFVERDLFIAQGASGGEIRIENVQVGGSLIIFASDVYIIIDEYSVIDYIAIYGNNVVISSDYEVVEEDEEEEQREQQNIRRPRRQVRRTPSRTSDTESREYGNVVYVPSHVRVPSQPAFPGAPVVPEEDEGVPMATLGALTDVRAAIGTPNISVEVSADGTAYLDVVVFSDVVGKTDDWLSGTRLASGRVSIDDVTEMEFVNLQLSASLPRYFVVYTVLTNSTGSHVSDPLININYTRAYEQFMAMTIYDFDQGSVINLDDSIDNNFMVATDGVFVITAGERGFNFLTLPGETQYTLSNACDVVLSLMPGDRIVVIDNSTNDIFAIEAAHIYVARDEVKIYGEHYIEVTDFFDFIKIYYTLDDAEFIVDMSEATEGVFLLPSSNNTIRRDLMPDNFDVCCNDHISIQPAHGRINTDMSLFSNTFAINHNISNNLSVNGYVTLGARLTVRFNHSVVWFGRDHVYFRFELKPYTEIGISLSGTMLQFERNLFLGKLSFPTKVPGLKVTFGFYIPLEGSVGATVYLRAESSLRVGFVFDRNNGGLQPITSADIDVRAGATGNFRVATGLRFTPGVSYARGLADANLRILFGIEFAGTVRSRHAELVMLGNWRHECDLCVTIRINRFIRLGVGTSFLYGLISRSRDFPDFRTSVGTLFIPILNDEESMFGGRSGLVIMLRNNPLTPTFVSDDAMISGERGFFRIMPYQHNANCPNNSYRITFEPRNAQGQIINDAAIVVRRMDNHREVVRGTGRFNEFLYPGNYMVTVMHGNIYFPRNFTVTRAETIVVPAFYVPITGLTINRSEMPLSIGSRGVLSANVTPYNATNSIITWTSSDPSVATVDNSGNVTAEGVGTAVITASVGSFAVSCTITVAINRAHLSLPRDRTIRVGATETLHPIISPSDASNQVFAWTSNNPSVATVDDNGTVTAIASGEAIIQLTVTGPATPNAARIVSTIINVINPVTSITFDEYRIELDSGETRRIAPNIYPINATNRNIGWSSNNPSYVRVYNDGTIRALRPGAAYITAINVTAGVSVYARVRVVVDGVDPENDPRPITISVTNLANIPYLTPFAQEVAINVSVSGLESGEFVELALLPNPYGISLLEAGNASISGNRWLTLVYDGTTSVAANLANVRLALNPACPGSADFHAEALSIGVRVLDGRTEARAIPVNQDNILMFNDFVNTEQGRTRHFRQETSITLATPSLGNSNWNPIGTLDSPFVGSFNGRNLSFSNLTIYRPGSLANMQGLFGSIGLGGVVRNVALQNVSITAARNIGGIAGSNSGTIKNSFSSGNIEGISTIGGLVGSVSYPGSVLNSYSTSNVSGEVWVGGLAGTVGGGIIRDSFATGNVTGLREDIGGLVGDVAVAIRSNDGYVHRSLVENSFSAGNVSSSYRGVGGLAGAITGGTIRNSVALNSSLSSASAPVSIGRITQTDTSNATYNFSELQNNHARYNMTLQNTTVASTNANDVHGAGISSNQFGSQAFWENTLGWDFSDDGSWMWGNNNLPILRNVGGNQNHIIPTAAPIDTFIAEVPEFEMYYIPTMYDTTYDTDSIDMLDEYCDYYAEYEWYIKTPDYAKVNEDDEISITPPDVKEPDYDGDSEDEDIDFLEL